MNSGIIRNALATTLALELEYREPCIVRGSGIESERSIEHQYPEQLFENEFA